MKVSQFLKQLNSSKQMIAFTQKQCSSQQEYIFTNTAVLSVIHTRLGLAIVPL